MKKLVLKIITTLILCVSASYALANNSQRGCASYIIPYMPYSITASQVIYVTRVPASWVGEGSDLSGAITAQAYDDNGNIYNLGEVGTAPANSVTRINAPLSQALQLQGLTNGKIGFRLQVANPENVYVYASYNAGSVRGYVSAECIR